MEANIDPRAKPAGYQQLRTSGMDISSVGPGYESLSQPGPLSNAESAQLFQQPLRHSQPYSTTGYGSQYQQPPAHSLEGQHHNFQGGLHVQPSHVAQHYSSPYSHELDEQQQHPQQQLLHQHTHHDRQPQPQYDLHQGAPTYPHCQMPPQRQQLVASQPSAMPSQIPQPEGLNSHQPGLQCTPGQTTAVPPADSVQVNAGAPATAAPATHSHGESGQMPQASSQPASAPSAAGGSTPGQLGGANGQQDAPSAGKKRGRPKGSRNRKTLEREGLLPPAPPPAPPAASNLHGDIPLNPPLKKRGRPPGSKNRRTVEKEQERLRLQLSASLPGAVASAPLPIGGTATAHSSGAPLNDRLQPQGGKPESLTHLLTGAMNAKGPGQNSTAACQGNVSAPNETSAASRPVAISGPAKEMIDKYGPAIVARYPELIGKFKVPGRKPGRPSGSKTVNRRTKEERDAKLQARLLPSGKRRGRPPGSKNRATLSKMSGNPTLVNGDSQGTAQAADQLAGSGPLSRTAEPGVRQEPMIPRQASAAQPSGLQANSLAAVVPTVVEGIPAQIVDGQIAEMDEEAEEQDAIQPDEAPTLPVTGTETAYHVGNSGRGTLSEDASQSGGALQQPGRQLDPAFAAVGHPTGHHADTQESNAHLTTHELVELGSLER